MKSKTIKGIRFFFIMTASILLLSKCSNYNLERYHSQLETVDTLIKYFETNDNVSIKKMMGIELSYIGMDDESLNYNVKKFHYYLQQYKIVPKENFEFKEYSKKNPRSVDIRVPFENKTSGKKIYLIVSFAKYIENGKILDFKIID